LDLGRGFEFGHGSGGADHPGRASAADVTQAGAGDIDQEPDGVIALDHDVRTARDDSRLTLAAVEQSKCFADIGGPVKSFDLIEHNLRGHYRPPHCPAARVAPSVDQNITGLRVRYNESG
jgi:hypothetical protein